MKSHAFKTLQKNTSLSKMSNRSIWRCSLFEREFEARNRPPKPLTILPAPKEKPCRDIRLLHNFVCSPSDSRLSIMEHLQGMLAILRITDDDVKPATQEDVFQAVDKLVFGQQRKRHLLEILEDDIDEFPEHKRLRLVRSVKNSAHQTEPTEELFDVFAAGGDKAEYDKLIELKQTEVEVKPSLDGLETNLPKPSSGRKNSPLHGDTRETNSRVLLENTKNAEEIQKEKVKCKPVSDHTLLNKENHRESDSILNQGKADVKNQRRKISVKASTLSVTLNNIDNKNLAQEDLRNRLLKSRAKKFKEESAYTVTKITNTEDSLVLSHKVDTTGHKIEPRRVVLLNNQKNVLHDTDVTLDKTSQSQIDIALECIKPPSNEEELRNKLVAKMLENKPENTGFNTPSTLFNTKVDSVDGVANLKKVTNDTLSMVTAPSDNTPESDIIVAELLQMVKKDTKAKKRQYRKKLKKEIKKEKKREKKLAKKTAKKARKLAAQKSKLLDTRKVTLSVSKSGLVQGTYPIRHVVTESNHVNRNMCNIENTTNVDVVQIIDNLKQKETKHTDKPDRANDKDKLGGCTIDFSKPDKSNIKAMLDENNNSYLANRDKYVVCITGDGIVRRANTGKYSMTKLMISQDELVPRRLRRRTKILKTVRRRNVDEQLYKSVLKKVAKDTAESKGLECCTAKCWRYNAKLTRRFARK